MQTTESVCAADVFWIPSRTAIGCPAVLSTCFGIPAPGNFNRDVSVISLNG